MHAIDGPIKIYILQFSLNNLHNLQNAAGNHFVQDLTTNQIPHHRADIILEMAEFWLTWINSSMRKAHKQNHAESEYEGGEQFHA